MKSEECENFTSFKFAFSFHRNESNLKNANEHITLIKRGEERTTSGSV